MPDHRSDRFIEQLARLGGDPADFQASIAFFRARRERSARDEDSPAPPKDLPPPTPA